MFILPTKWQREGMYPLQAPLSLTVGQVYMCTWNKCVTLLQTVLMEKTSQAAVSIA